MQLISKYNKGIRYLLCAIDLFRKYARTAPIKDKKGITVVDCKFKSTLDSSKRNFIAVFSKNCQKTIKLKCIQHAIKKKLLSLKDLLKLVLDDIVNKYNNTFHRTIKVKAIDVKSDSYAE